MVRTLKEFLRANEQVISQLIGDKRIVISERRGPNTASTLFAKSAFSQLVSPRGTDQRCRTGGCLTCGTMNLDRQPRVRDTTIKLDFSLNCKSDNCIYIAICKHCVPCEFYVGQTINPLRACFVLASCLLRACFQLSNFKYEQSALSLHVFEKHIETFQDKLNNFNLGVITSTSPKDLNRKEDFYIYISKADSISLNRIKVIS